MSLEMPVKRGNRVASQTEINENTLKRNKDAGHLEIEEKLSGANGVISDISFLY